MKMALRPVMLPLVLIVVNQGQCTTDIHGHCPTLRGRD